MGNGVDSGVTAETSYLLTGVKFWPSGTTFEEVIEVESVSLDVTSKELEVGESFVLTPSFNPSDAEIEISEFKSSNPSVVTVNNFGQVSAVELELLLLLILLIMINQQHVLSQLLKQKNLLIQHQ